VSVDCSTRMKCYLIRKIQSVDVGLDLFSAEKQIALTKMKKLGELPH